MIDPGIFTKSSVFNISDIETEQIPFDDASPTQVNKSTMYHLLHAHIYQIFNDTKMEPMLKQKLISQFGHKLGFNMVEEQCLGFVKYCYPKPDGKGKVDFKQFIGEVKILSSKIWNVLVGSKPKLFALPIENSYKIQDKQFTLGYSTKKPANERQKQYHRYLIVYCQGFVKGALDKFNLSGEILCYESIEGAVCVELRSLYRKTILNNYNEYSQKISKDIAIFE